ncbi:MAG: fluoride efflux transporter FluC [Gemmatimonadales bacterium]
MQALLTVGFCGSYTTFSTFSYEALTLLQDRDYPRAALYVEASVVVSLGAAFLGMALAREVLILRRGL